MRIRKISKNSFFLLVAFCGLSLCLFGIKVEAYSQGSYYGQGYYQANYYAQTYYQSTYGINFTTDVTIDSTLFVTGGVSKGAGTFVIDHPLDPENKLLYHSFVESPDVKNIYDGVAVVGENGEVVVTLPHYFEALNNEYRYQVKGITEASPNLYIKKEIEGNQFIIAGGQPGSMVSWQVTGIRQDPYILANPVINEVEKGPDELVDKGEFLFEGYKDLIIDRGFFGTIKYHLINWWSKLIDWIIFWD